MKRYPKIETIFERDNDFNVMPDRLKSPVLDTINKWSITEKIDGMNIRVHFDYKTKIMSIAGRSMRANIPRDLGALIFRKMSDDAFADIADGRGLSSITLYGEGYGAGIQKGGHYRADKGFILFDVLVNDEFWLNEAAVTSIASKFDIPRVPILGVVSLYDAVKLVKTGFCSWIADSPFPAEGVVGKPIEPLYNSRKERIIIKLKTKDFNGEKK